MRAPIVSFTAVREPLAPTENACVSPAAAFAAPMTSNSCPARTCSPRLPAKARAVRISSANETRKTATAAGASFSRSASCGVGRLGRGRPAGTGPTVAIPWPAKSKIQEAAIAQTTTSSAPGSTRQEAPQEQQRGERDDAHGDGGSADVAELADHLGQALQRLGRRDLEAEQLAQLGDDQDDRHPVQVADQHRPGEVVRDPAEP